MGDKRANQSIALLLEYGIDPNDECNGVLLPRNGKNIPHSEIPGAYAHTAVHTRFYHANVLTVLMRADVPGATKEDIEEALREIAEDLASGTFPVDRLVNR